MSFTLAAGAPLLQGLKIEKASDDPNSISVTLAPGAPLKSWNREWIKATIVRSAKDLGIQQPLSMSEIQACITRMLLGEFVANYKIPTHQATPAPTSSDKPYSVIANRNKGDIGVIVNQLSAFSDEKLMEQVIADVMMNIDALKKIIGG